jgi:hypothetical protein
MSGTGMLTDITTAGTCGTNGITTDTFPILGPLDLRRARLRRGVAMPVCALSVLA